MLDSNMNIRLKCSTHGMKTSNCQTSKCRTPTYNPWNFNFKLSDSHIQPMELQLQTVWLPCSTHGMKASNHLTLTSNPWNEGVTISSPIVWIWLPRADLGSAYKLAPQSPGLPQTKRPSMRVSWSILKLREESSLSVGTIYSFQKRSSDQTYVNKHKQIL